MFTTIATIIMIAVIVVRVVVVILVAMIAAIMIGVVMVIAMRTSAMISDHFNGLFDVRAATEQSQRQHEKKMLHFTVTFVD
jgi:uncharacterized membrane protein YqiK